jgi:ribose transport system substrate-binding protein
MLSRRRRTRTTLALAIALALAAVAYAGAATSGSAHAQGKGPWVIGFEEPLGGQPWRETGLATLQALANKPGWKEHVKQLIIVRTQNNDPAAQVAAMRNLIAKGVNLLIFDPASPTAASPVIAQAKARGITVVAAAQTVQSPDAYIVSPDWDKAAAIGATWLLKRMKAPKNVVLLEGFKGAPVNESGMAVARKIFKNGGAHVVAQDSNGWDESVAQKVMSTILQSTPNINGVFSLFAGGHGIPEAFKAANRPFVPIVGGSGYNTEACTLKKYKPQGLQAILTDGRQSTYAKALDVGLKILKGQKQPRVQLYAPYVITTDDNLNKWCLQNAPQLFGTGYAFPGLPITLKDVLRYFNKG